MDTQTWMSQRASVEEPGHLAILPSLLADNRCTAEGGPTGIDCK